MGWKKFKSWIQKKGEQVVNVVKDVGQAVTNIIKNPLPVIETIALSAMGVPPPIANAIVTGMNGGSPADMLKASVASSVPIIGSQVAQNLGVSTVVGNAVASTAVQTAMGVPLDKALSNTIANVAVTAARPEVSSQISEIVSNPTVAKSLTNMALNAGSTFIKGGDSSDIANSITNSLTKSAVSGGLDLAKEALSPPTPSTEAIAYNLPKSSTEAESTEEKPVAQGPLGQLSTVDYSLSAPSGLGIKASLAEQPMTVGESPVDYSLGIKTTGEPDLQLPTMPGLKQMGGAQGLTVPVEGGTVGALGFTPTDASVVLGDPKSFINDPNVLGKPVMQVDPEYLQSAGKQTSGESTLYSPQRFAGLQYAFPDMDSDIKWLDTRAQMLKGKLPKDAVTGDAYKYGEVPSASVPSTPSLSPFAQFTPEMKDVLADRGYHETMMASGGGVQGYACGCSVTKYMDQFTPKFYTAKCNMLTSTSGSRKAPLTLTALKQIRPSLVTGGCASSFAKGGLPSKYHEAAPKGHNPEFITGLTGYYAGGRGTGQSDDIPAMLHDGDYVIDAEAVSAFGDGSSKAGNEVLMNFMHQVPHSKTDSGKPVPAKIADGEVVLPASFVTALGGGDNKHGAKMLDEMRKRLREHKRSAPDTKIPPKAKTPLQYLQDSLKVSKDYK